ncbi:MAG: hypothetical protein KDA41_14760, partial [Planctomycetales bacterium]|nr:hypothetical protein [Planctomycetales bacterium]
AIGLLGIAALLPVAQHLANRGSDADRGAIAGHAAMGVFQAREMGNPKNWLRASGVAFAAGDSDYPLNPAGTRAFCLDPRGVAAGVTAALPSAGTMTRITLRSEPGSATGAMGVQLADNYFSWSDDLDFVIDENDATQPAAQKPEPSAASFEKRYSPNDFTWMATLVRELSGDRYTLSIVVFRKRDVSATVELTSPCTILSAGIGGGDVKLTNANAAGIAPGSWVMLSDTAGRFRWYRVIYAADYVSGTTSRELTLAGRDWDGGAAATATIIPGVVAVYERTVRLEQTNPWMR